MAARGVSAAKAGPKSVATPRERPQMVLGSRPPDMYSPRIKPADASQRQYGKKRQPAGADPSTIGFSSMLGGPYGNS